MNCFVCDQDLAPDKQTHLTIYTCRHKIDNTELYIQYIHSNFTDQIIAIDYYDHARRVLSYDNDAVSWIVIDPNIAINNCFVKRIKYDEFDFKKEFDFVVKYRKLKNFI